ncbi:MAG: ABC transporter substrate-binding protein, partial [Acetatifactor sp.]|nr:ABC transporter substrate-binding protein [Acetatifactor sp.]
MQKRIVAIILAVSMGISMLAGCGASGAAGNTSEANGTETNTETGAPSSEEENYDGKLVPDGVMEVDYAKGFSIELFKGGYRMLTVGDPAAKYLVVPEEMSVPGELDETVTVLQMPIDNVYIASTGMVSLMNAIDALDYVKLVATDADGWYIDEVKAAVEDGRIGFSGNYKEPDYEMMVERDIQLHIDNAMVDSVPEVNEKFIELGIPNLVEISSKENHPLARVEWVKLLGGLCGREAEAQAYFDNQKALMDQATAAESSGITVAMGYITSSGKCYARNGGDYLV